MSVIDPPVSAMEAGDLERVTDGTAVTVYPEKSVEGDVDPERPTRALTVLSDPVLLVSVVAE